MKKILAVVLAVIVMFTFAACGSKECEICGKEGKTKKYTVQGKSAYLCETCGGLADLANSMTGFGK